MICAGTARAIRARMTQDQRRYESGKKLLHAVERMLADDEHLLATKDRLLRSAGGDRDDACSRAIAEFSNRSAYAGAVAAAPGLVPGGGTVVALGMTFVEMTYVMKTEVELCLVLSAIRGFDIRTREHRQVAFLLAALATHEVEADDEAPLAWGRAGLAAVWNYAPRELSKRVVEVFGLLVMVRAAMRFGHGVLRALPIVGVCVGAGINKTLSRRVGRRADEALRARAATISASSADRAAPNAAPYAQPA